MKGRRLVVREGRFTPLSFARYSNGNFREPMRAQFRPRQLPYDSILVEGASGMITFEAMRWLMHHGVPVFMLDYDGSLISAVMPPGPVCGDLRRAQTEAHLDPRMRLKIAHAFVEAKLLASLEVLNWLRESHDVEGEVRQFRGEAHRLRDAKTVDQIRGAEAHGAEVYWQAFQKAVPSKLEFRSRSSRARSMRARNASDPVNALLNYGYAFLQSYVRRAINMTGLDASLGYLHDSLKSATTPLVYDFQEPYRWLVDYTVLRMVLPRTFSWDDFYFAAEDFRLRMKPPLLDRYVKLLRGQFNSSIVYGGKRLMWDTVILRKCQELARYLLVPQGGSFDLTSPRPVLQRSDTRDLREKILGLSQPEARKLGIGKGTLHYLREKAATRACFRVYSKVRKRLMPESTFSLETQPQKKERK